MRNIVTLSLTLLLSTTAAQAADQVAATADPIAPVAPVVSGEAPVGQPEQKQSEGKAANPADKSADADKAAPVPGAAETAK